MPVPAPHKVASDGGCRGRRFVWEVSSLGCGGSRSYLLALHVMLAKLVLDSGLLAHSETLPWPLKAALMLFGLGLRV